MTGATTGEEMERRIAEDGIDHVFCEFADINGISRSKVLSAEAFLDAWEAGPSVNLAILVQTPRNDVPEGSGWAGETDYADGRLRLDPGTFRVLPWRENAARVMGNLEFRGEPVAASPRRALRRVIDGVPSDLDIRVGNELEFYLLDSGEAPGDYEPVTSGKHECVSWATEEAMPFYERLVEWAGAYGVPVSSIQHEHGPGQFEVLFDHGEPFEAADRAFDFKRLVKRTARHSGRHATFMAKPFAGESGSGYHLHVSARDGDGDAFAAGDGDADGDELSEPGRRFVGGLLEHADALVALGTPTLNGFKRYDPEGFVPYTASWGYDHRQVAVRVPGTGATRIENRLGAADANPYLVIAATLAAGLHGIEEGIEPGDPIEGNPAGRRPELLRTPGEALAALEGDGTLVDRLGEEVVRAYVATKRRGLRAFRETVTPWERERYVETL